MFGLILGNNVFGLNLGNEVFTLILGNEVFVLTLVNLHNCLILRNKAFTTEMDTI